MHHDGRYRADESRTRGGAARSRGAAIRFWIGFAATIVAGLIGLSLRAPISGLFDPRWPALFCALGGLLLVVAGWRRGGGGGWARPAYVIFLMATGSVITFAFLGHREIEVRFSDGGAQLVGTLFEPRSSGPHPAVVFVHGSSPGTRGVFRPLAYRFARSGVAALAYDKRGFGESDGELPYTYGELANDAAAAVDFLRHRPEIEDRQIGLMGFSEGGWTAPLAATRSEHVAFLIVVSGGALTPAEQERWEMKARLEDAGIRRGDIARALELEKRLQDYYRTGEGGESLITDVDRVKRERWFRVAFEIAPDRVPESLDDVEYTHDPTELDFDALPLLRSLDMPMLFIYGGADRTVPPRESARVIRETFAASEHSEARVLMFPGADHLILVWPLGHAIPLPRFAPGFLNAVTSWISGRSQRGGPHS